MNEEMVMAIRVTQILKDEGWTFVDAGYNHINRVANETTGEKIYFTSEEAFEEWFTEKSKVLL